ncbi:hypothetical protein FAI40_03815 [Acetobacteraceae bacterium]|nr:hypothetical protein FAI40_03815 [Acetobacteraceae bacterium]
MKKRFLLPLSALLFMASPSFAQLTNGQGVYTATGATKCADFLDFAAKAANNKEDSEDNNKLYTTNAYSIGMSDMIEKSCRKTEPKEKCAGDLLTPDHMLESAAIICKKEPDKQFGDAIVAAWIFLKNTNIKANENKK